MASLLHLSTIVLFFLSSSSAQQAGTQTPEVHPKLTWQDCTSLSGCTTQQGSIVLDANWRWLHETSGYADCFTGNEWNAIYCPDPVTCAENCALDGANYTDTYGITTSGNAIRLAFETSSNVGSRVYLLDSSDENYQLFNLLGKELSFDVELSTLPCGLNGALYFSQMDADGGLSRYPTNKAGAKYGTGYCDSQCPHDIKFINGEANVEDWNATSETSGVGEWGTCCSEMDVWEANSVSAAFTPHPCSVGGQTECGGYADVACSTACDQAGCDFNSYRMGNKSFYGPGNLVDTTEKFTVVTQFMTDDGTSSGDLVQISRFYVQNGVVIANSESTIPGVTGNSITDSLCDAQKTAFGDTNTFEQQGGLTQMGEAFKAGMVLVLSIWDDATSNMLWLDSDYPPTANPTSPGVARGPCPTSSGQLETVEASDADAFVIFSNIKISNINATIEPTPPGPPGGGPSTTSTKSITSSVTTTSTTTATTVTVTDPPQQRYGQCGGRGYTGPTICASGSTCTAVSPPWYYQCL